MIYINHNKKAIFIHIPKTGGSYIGPTLVRYYGFTSFLPLINGRRPDHNHICKTHYFKQINTGIKQYDNSFFNKLVGILVYCKTSSFFNSVMKMDEEKWKSYTKFCFIRNPYERALSGWKHINIILNKKMLFYDYISQDKFLISDIEYGHVFMDQKTQIQDEQGTCGVDYIGRFEYLEDDFQYILKQIGFTKILHKPEKVNVSNEEGTANIALDNLTVIKLNEIFFNDFSLFHYKALEI